MNIYSLTKDDLENTADKIKPVVLAALVKDGLISQADAETWCENHTVILRKKSFFRTLSDKWHKTKDDSGLIYIVVGK